MLAERLLTRVVRSENERQLKLGPYPKPTLPAPGQDRGYMLYAHVPFCERLCPYCSFNRFPFEDTRARDYFRRLREELRIVADLGYDFESMYLGGGTPTILVEELAATIDLARELFSIKEVSAETNPNHLLPDYMEPLRGKVQRMSVGVQSFDDGLLKEMDRFDKYGDGRLTLERIQAMEGFFPSLNVDMIFNFPSQTETILRHDLEMVKESGGNQTTFYPLMASPAVARSLARTVGPVDYKREQKFFHVIAEGLADTFEPSSAWTFSRIGGGMIDEYIVDYEEYVGLGSGAFSFLDGAMYCETFSLRDYGAALDGGRQGVVAWRQFAKREQMRYRFLMELFGLRMDKRRFERDFGGSPDKLLPLEMTFMRTAGGFATDTPDEATLTLTGRYLMVALMREFFVGVNNVRDQARAALTPEERDLLFGDGATCAEKHDLAGAAEQTESATDVLPPVGPRG
jgi:coproporphyrinogen III oxidase-like Fe-S oxidoreductase